MMRRVWALVFLTATLTPVLIGAAPQTVRVVVNGRALPDNATEVIDAKVYVAVRPVAQALGADVALDWKQKTVTVTTLLRQVMLRLDDPWATVNGQRVQLSAPARRSGARVVLPLRAIGDAFGATIVYEPDSHTVIVSATLRSATFGRSPTAPPIASTSTLEGTVTAVAANALPPTVQVNAKGGAYTITVPAGTKIEFRDIHGAVTGNGVLSQVKPGDALFATLDAGGRLIAVADIFSGINGTVASVAEQSMVLTSGRVISADPAVVSVTLDGRPATFASLQAGDKVSIRADPRSGKVRDVVALTPGGFATSATSTPSAGAQGSTGSVRIASVTDNAGAALRAGQVLKIKADGTAGGNAEFDLSDVIIDNPMRETRPGHYEGQYLVGVGTNLTDAPILVRLSKNGETALAEAPHPLNIVTSPPAVKETAPGAGARINTSRPNIFATFTTVGSQGMDAGSLHMTLNGRDVTSQTTRTGAFISYYPSADLGSGPVVVEIKGTDTAGNTLDYRWSFVVLGK